MQVSITFEVDNAVFEDQDGRIEDGDRDFVSVDRNGNAIGRCAIE